MATDPTAIYEMLYATTTSDPTRVGSTRPDAEPVDPEVGAYNLPMRNVPEYAIDTLNQDGFVTWVDTQGNVWQAETP